MSLLWFVILLCGGCVAAAVPQPLVAYDDPDGRFSISIPAGWQTDSASGRYELLAGEPVEGNAQRFSATLGLIWGPLPCDRSMVQDPVAWYADVMCWGPNVAEHSRTEEQVDGRRALLVDWSAMAGDGGETRQLSLLTEAYGVVWEATCSAPQGREFDAHEAVFREMLLSLVVHGAWSGVPEG